MTRKLRDLRDLTRDHGAVAVLVAVCLLVILGVSALALDGGLLFNERRSAQNAATNASLAAAWADCNGGDPVAQGLAIAAENGFDNDGTSNVVTVTDLGGQWEVVIWSTIDGDFSPFLGADQNTAAARSVAECAIVSGLGGYAIYAGAESCGPTELQLTGSSQTIEGGIHSNGELHLSGNAASPGDVHGPVTVQSFMGGSNPQISNVNIWDDGPPGSIPGSPGQVGYIADPGAGVWNLADYQPGGAMALLAASYGEYYSYTSNQSWSSLTPGLYYVDGNVTLDSINASGVTIVATGIIKLRGSSNTLDQPYNYGMAPPAIADNGLSLFSVNDGAPACNNKAIEWSGSNHDWNGVQYANNGAVDMSAAANSAFSGSIIAYTVKLAGSDINIAYVDEFAGEPLTFLTLEE